MDEINAGQAEKDAAEKPPHTDEDGTKVDDTTMETIHTETQGPSRQVIYDGLLAGVDWIAAETNTLADSAANGAIQELSMQDLKGIIEGWGLIRECLQETVNDCSRIGSILQTEVFRRAGTGASSSTCPAEPSVKKAKTD